ANASLVALVDGQQLLSPNVPETERLVRACRGEQFAVVAESKPPYVLGMSFQAAELVSLAVPEVNRLVVAAGRQHAAGGCKGDRVDGTPLAEREQFLPRRGVPEFHRAVPAGIRDNPSVGRERYSRDVVGVSLEAQARSGTFRLALGLLPRHGAVRAAIPLLAQTGDEA